MAKNLNNKKKLIWEKRINNLQAAYECYVTNAFYELVIHLCFLFLSFVLCSVHPIYHRLYHYSPVPVILWYNGEMDNGPVEVLVWYLVLLGILTRLMVSEYLILGGMLYTQWKTPKFWMILETFMSILFTRTMPGENRARLMKLAKCLVESTLFPKFPWSLKHAQLMFPRICNSFNPQQAAFVL